MCKGEFKEKAESKGVMEGSTLVRIEEEPFPPSIKCVAAVCSAGARGPGDSDGDDVVKLLSLTVSC